MAGVSTDTVRRLVRDWRRLAPHVVADLIRLVLELDPGHADVVPAASHPIPEDPSSLRMLARLATILEGIRAQQGYTGIGGLGAVNLWFQGVPGWF